MRFKLACTIVAGILLTALSAAPAGATTNTITIGSPVTLTDRVLVTVPITIVCDPMAGTEFFSAYGVFVTQASGTAVATGQFINEASPVPLFTCDGVTHNNFVVDVLPDSGSPPFHGGGAIVQASFSIGSFVCQCFEGQSTTMSVHIRG